MTDSSEKKISPQAAFTEEQIREGHSLEDIKMWQNLCKALALLEGDAEADMHGVLSICDQEGLSPLTICSQMRSMGFQTVAEGIDAALQFYQERDGSDGGDDVGHHRAVDNEAREHDDDDDDQVEEDAVARSSSKRRWNSEPAESE